MSFNVTDLNGSWTHSGLLRWIYLWKNPKCIKESEVQLVSSFSQSVELCFKVKSGQEELWVAITLVSEFNHELSRLCKSDPVPTGPISCIVIRTRGIRTLPALSFRTPAGPSSLLILFLPSPFRIIIIRKASLSGSLRMKIVVSKNEDGWLFLLYGFFYYPKEINLNSLGQMALDNSFYCIPRLFPVSSNGFVHSFIDKLCFLSKH